MSFTFKTRLLSATLAAAAACSAVGRLTAQAPAVPAPPISQQGTVAQQGIILPPGQPSTPSQPAAGPTPVVRTYVAPIGTLSLLAADLQQQFAAAGARIALDERSNQVLVVADEALQQAVAARCAQWTAQQAVAAGPPPQAAAYPALPTTPTSPAPAPAAAGSAPLFIQAPYENLDWPTFEENLRTIYGSRLSPATTTEDGWRRLRLATVEGPPLEIGFRHFADRANGGEVAINGPEGTANAARRLLSAFNRKAEDVPQRVVPYRKSGEQALRQALAVSHRMAPSQPEIASAPRALPPAAVPAASPRGTIPLLNNLFQPQSPAAQAQIAQAQAQAAQAQPAPAAAQPPAAGQPVVQPPVVVQPIIVPPVAGAAPPAGAAPAIGAAGAPAGGLVGPVQIEFLEGLDVLIISGNDRDVERVMKIIEDIERLSVDTQPTIDVLPLQHVASDVMAGVVTQIYDSVLSMRQGRVTITALVKPNALLLIGRAESIAAVRELVGKLDQPVDASTQFAVYPLKHATAAAVQPTLQAFFADRPALGGKVQVTADARSNALIVRAGPRDLSEAAELIKRLDVSTGEAEAELRVFTLQHSLAVELAPVLQDAIAAQAGTSASTQPQTTINIGTAPQPQQQSAPGGPTGRSNALIFTTIDSQGHRQLRSGILTEVRITADPRANALLVAAPAEAMELIAALIRQLDGAPAAESQIKVFTIVNGDASSLVEMLQALFGIRTATQGGGGFLGTQQQQTPQGQNPLIQMRFSVDQRTNSIIATGAADDLNVVEAILLRLDESDVRQRQSVVYRLKNAPANDVANAINQFLRSERDVQQANPAFLSPFEQIEREVVVVPEPVSNSLIVSATPRYFEEIRKLVEDIDARPPMVLIQVLIAEVALNNTDEFGAEIGLQDSVLFDRSLLGNLVTITNSTQQAVPGGGTITTQNQNVVAATNTPGFGFNNAPLGNSGSNTALAKANVIGTQGISSFAVGRTNADLGFGGLVLSASSESVSVLIRALQESRRLDVLSRPQVMTLDNQPAFVQVGARVPRVQGVTINNTGQVNNVVDVNVGLILGVTPRISPDGLVVMEIDAEKSALGPEAEGVPISIAANGDVVRQPVINTTTAQTTVSAMNGQTVVLGGLITKTRAQTHRRVPILSSIPLLGNLFRYDLEATERTELLIIMTPHVVRNEDDANKLRQIETSRMSWVLGDVKKVHGSAGFGGYDVLADDETVVIYPDQTPGAEQIPAGKPVETSAPQQQNAVDPSTPPGATPPATTAPGTTSPGTASPGAAPAGAPGVSLPQLPPQGGSEPKALPMSDGAAAHPLHGGDPIGVDLSSDELLPTTVSYGTPQAPRGASIVPAVPPAYLSNPPAALPAAPAMPPAVLPAEPMPTNLPTDDSGLAPRPYLPEPQAARGYGAPTYVQNNAGPGHAPTGYAAPSYAAQSSPSPTYGGQMQTGTPFAANNVVQPAGRMPADSHSGQVVPVGYVAPISNIGPDGNAYGNPYANGSVRPAASAGVGR